MAVKKDETKKVVSKKRNTKAKKTTEKTLVNNAETKEEKEVMADGYKRAVKAVEMLVTGDVEAAMNEYNKKVNA